MLLRDQRGVEGFAEFFKTAGAKAKNLQTPAKRGMKAFNGSCSALAAQAGLILLLTEKSVPKNKRDQDEHRQTVILTSGLSLAPAFPAFDQWLWEFVTRYSGATVPDFHGVP